MNAKQMAASLSVAAAIAAGRIAIGQELHPPAPPRGSLQEEIRHKIAAMTNRADAAEETPASYIVAVDERMPPRPGQWLTLHKRTLDYVRATLRGLPENELLWIEPGLEDETQERGCGEPRPFSIAGVVKHICDAEQYWLREVRIAPEFEPPPPDQWRVEVFLDTLNRIEDQYRRILADRPDDPDILFGLSRACQHNLMHGAQAAHLRVLQEPDWRSPGAHEVGSWERAVDYQAHMLIGRQPGDWGVP